MKRPLSIILVVLSTIYVVLLTTISLAQNIPTNSVREYFEDEERLHFNSLKKKYGNKKDLPPGFELQTLLALSHYPELEDIRIRFIVDDVAIPLSSRPYWATLFRSAFNRTYLVVIDRKLDGPRDVVLLKNQPFNAQVGIIGHELAHTVYYLDRSFFGILADAFCQLSNCRIDFERNTDTRLIKYGLGWQRYDHAMFVRKRLSRDPSAETANQEGGGAYMTPNELLTLINKNEAYAN